MYEKQDKQYTYLEEFEKSLDAELRNESKLLVCSIALSRFRLIGV